MRTATNDERNIYQVWRPEGSPWSKWVKPVVFAFLRPGDHGDDQYTVQDWQVPPHPDAAIVADLPGAESVSAGIALARAGYLPVLVYNACPTEVTGGVSSELDSQHISPPVAVDMSSILSAICSTTKELASVAISAQAPPVFLLDGNRRGLGTSPGPGWFDNRSFVTSSDFPSADYFRLHGISKIILLQVTPSIHPDLLHVLLRWQREGLIMATQAPWKPWAPSPFTVKPPAFIVSAWEWISRKFGSPRNFPDGSFGVLLPPSSS
jgi:hypothetical protein